VTWVPQGLTVRPTTAWAPVPGSVAACRWPCRVMAAGVWCCAEAAARPDRLGVVPVVQHVGHHAGVGARWHRLEEVPGDDLAAVRDPGRLQHPGRAARHLGQVEQDAAQVRVGPQDGGQQDALPAADVGHRAQPGEVVGRDQQRRRAPAGIRRAPAGAAERWRTTDCRTSRNMPPSRLWFPASPRIRPTGSRVVTWPERGPTTWLLQPRRSCDVRATTTSFGSSAGPRRARRASPASPVRSRRPSRSRRSRPAEATPCAAAGVLTSKDNDVFGYLLT